MKLSDRSVSSSSSANNYNWTKRKKNEDVLFVEKGNEISANIINHREQKKSIREHKH